MLMTEYKIIRSNRKTLSLEISDGELLARAPLHLSVSDIEKFILSKTDWINSNLPDSKKIAQKRKEFNLTYGSNILYLGKEYPIEKKVGNSAGFNGEFFYMPPFLTCKQIIENCIKIYKLLAKEYLNIRVSGIAKQIGIYPASIKITGATTRWGSCSRNKNINFSWRLIMADNDTVDYVIIHELVHLIEMNHSSRFWEIVKSYVPEYETCINRLHELSKRIIIENW